MTDKNKICIPKMQTKDNRNEKPMFTKFYWDLLCKQQEEERKSQIKE